MGMTEHTEVQDKRPFKITVVSVTDLVNVTMSTKKDVYVVVSIKGDTCTTQEQKTHVHEDCGPNPTWNFTMKFTLDEAAVQQNRLTLKFEIISKQIVDDKEIHQKIGKVSVPIKKLLNEEPAGDGKESRDVWTASEEVKGTLNFTYKFGDKYNAPPPVEAMAYPRVGYPGSSSAPHAPPPGGYDAPPRPGSYPKPPPGAYTPQQQGGYPAPTPSPGAYLCPPPGAYSQQQQGGYPAPLPSPGAYLYPPPGAYSPQQQGGYPAPLPSSGAYLYPPPGAYSPQQQGGYPAPLPSPGLYLYPPAGAYSPYAYRGYPAPRPSGYGYPGYPPQQPPRVNSRFWTRHWY